MKMMASAHGPGQFLLQIETTASRELEHRAPGSWGGWTLPGQKLVRRGNVWTFSPWSGEDC